MLSIVCSVCLSILPSSSPVIGSMAPRSGHKEEIPGHATYVFVKTPEHKRLSRLHTKAIKDNIRPNRTYASARRIQKLTIDSGIIPNCMKIEADVRNAQAFLKI